MPDDPRPSKSLSRRTVASAALAIPVVGASSISKAAAADSVDARCRDWLASAAEHERLSLSWQSLESRMMRRPEWAKMSEAERHALPEVVEMAQIDEAITGLSDQQERGLDVLSKLRPANLGEAAALMAVAAYLIQYEEELPHKLICNALKVLGRAS